MKMIGMVIYLFCYITYSAKFKVYLLSILNELLGEVVHFVQLHITFLFFTGVRVFDILILPIIILYLCITQTIILVL